MQIKIKHFPAWHKYFARELIKDVDVSLIITGPKGFGKSTLTIWMMLWTEAYFNKGIAVVEPVLESLTWKTDEWISKMKEEYRYKAIGFEEFGNAATVEEVNNLINEMIRKVQSSNRFLNILKIFNVPGFVHVPPKVRNTMNFWINVQRKGVGTLYLVVPEEGPDQRPMKFFKHNLGRIQYSALPDIVYSKYKQIKKEVELKRFQESAMKVQDIQFRKLPVAQKRKILAELILQLHKKYGDKLVEINKSKNEIIKRLRWSYIAMLLAKEFRINISEGSLRGYFKEFKNYGWSFIEDIANL